MRQSTPILALALLLALVLAAPLAAQTQAERPVALDAGPVPQAGQPRNIVLMIADGFGPAAATLGRAAKGAPLALDSILVGAVETSATDSRVTDSAASATAYACGIKTYRGAIAVDTTGAPCRTILEAAEARGMATRLVATGRPRTRPRPRSRPTPVPGTGRPRGIARQMAASGVDLLFGGGARFFVGPASGAPLAEAMAADGWAIALDRAGYDALDALPAAAFLASSNLAYEIDRDETDQPSLAEMTEKALDLLAAGAGERGFFLDGRGQPDRRRDPQERRCRPPRRRPRLRQGRRRRACLGRPRREHPRRVHGRSRDGRAHAWTRRPQPLGPRPAPPRPDGFVRGHGRADRGRQGPAETIRQGLGYDALPEGAAEVFRGAVAANDPSALLPLLVALASEPAAIGWTTRAHTGVDVGLYAWGPGADRFRGVMANDAVGRALFAVLGLETARAGR